MVFSGRIKALIYSRTPMLWMLGLQTLLLYSSVFLLLTHMAGIVPALLVPCAVILLVILAGVCLFPSGIGCPLPGCIIATEPVTIPDHPRWLHKLRTVTSRQRKTPKRSEVLSVLALQGTLMAACSMLLTIPLNTNGTSQAAMMPAFVSAGLASLLLIEIMASPTGIGMDESIDQNKALHSATDGIPATLERWTNRK